jgi:hypothetical protein
MRFPNVSVFPHADAQLTRFGRTSLSLDSTAATGSLVVGRIAEQVHRDASSVSVSTAESNRNQAFIVAARPAAEYPQALQRLVTARLDGSVVLAVM